MITNISAWKFVILALQIIFKINFGAGSPFSQGNIMRIQLNKSTGQHGDVCTTSVCKKTASKLRKDMNLKVDPCDNFYHFVCGSFINSTIIPDDETEVNNFLQTQNEIDQQLRLSIEATSPPNESNLYALAKKLYRSCMNESAIEKQGTKPLLEILKDLGGWPVLVGNDWNESEFNWIETTLALNNFGYSVDYLMDFDLDVDMNNKTRYILTLDQGTPRSFSDDYSWEVYFNFINEIAVALGAQEDSIASEVLLFVLFEKNISEILLPTGEGRNYTLSNNVMTIGDLKKKYPSILWNDYFTGNLPSDITIDDSEQVRVMAPKYIKSLEELIENTPNRTLANYMMWKTVEKSLLFMNDKIRRISLNFTSQFGTETEMQPRWKECVGIVKEYLPISIGALYIHDHVNEEMKMKVSKMVEEIRKQLDRTLRKVNWMDEGTKKNALDKIASMSIQIAFPKIFSNISEYERYYEDLEIPDDNYLLSGLNISKYSREGGFSFLREPFDTNETFFNPTDVNAYNWLYTNSLFLPAGILQSPFFSSNRPMYMNYGGIGSLIGHEMTHSFDDEGRQFNKDGNLVDWWDPVTDKKYRQKIQCIINQYGNYFVDEIEMNVDGNNTQGENIADNGGIKIAYLAYKNWLSENKPEPQLPGLDYTSEQMYWISTANARCSKERTQSLINDVLADEHSPDEFRIIGSLSNIPEFSKDFKCPAGSKMNPMKKCDLW